MKDCRFRVQPYGCGRSLCGYPHGNILCDPPESKPGEFEKYACKKDVCPVLTFEDYDKSRCCPLCGVLGQGIS